MRNYHLNTDRIINQLVPHYMGGRKLVLFIQSLVYPLQSLADKFAAWAGDVYQESAMTSQVFLLEYFLTRRFSKYFLRQEDRITISDTEIEGNVLYWEYARAKRRNLALFGQEEDSRDHPYFFWKDERQKYTGVSFIVSCPAIDTSKIRAQDMTAMLSGFVNRYRIAGKTFKIEYKK